MHKGLCITLAIAFSLCATGGPAAAKSSAVGSNVRVGSHHRVAARADDTDALSQLLISDMTQPSQDLPQGVPTSYDWATHPRVRPLTPMLSYQAFTAWSQLYQCAGTTPSKNETVDLSDLQSWVLLRGAAHWRRIQFTSDMQGAAYAEDFVGPTVAAHYVAGPDGTRVEPVVGHNFHFWPSAGRVSLRATDVLGLIVAVRARLGSSVPRGATSPCLVLSVGGDMWKSPTAQPGGSSSGDVGIGRFKRVDRQWRLFTMTTASPRLMRRFPLPLIAPLREDF